MKYDNLNDLIRKSSSSRQFFLSLPVDVQLQLHGINTWVRTAAELHRRAEEVKILSRQVQLSEFYDFGDSRGDDV